MEISIKSQLICILVSLIFGALSAILFGFFRFAVRLLVGGRRDSGRLGIFLKRAVQFVFDLLFCIAVSVSFQILLYVCDYGRFRLVYLLSAILGFVMYDKTLGKLTDKLFGFIADLLGKIISFVFRYVSLPVKLLFSVIGKMVKKAVRLTVLKPYCAFVRRNNVKKIRRIIQRDLSDLVKF